METMSVRREEAGWAAEARRPATETEAQLPRSSDSLLEERRNQAEVWRRSMSRDLRWMAARRASLGGGKGGGAVAAGRRGGNEGPQVGGGERWGGVWGAA